MKMLVYILLMVLTVVVSSQKPYYDLKDAPRLFEKFMKDYNRVYKDEADKQLHYGYFVQNLKNLNEWNSRPNDGATYGINFFSDMTPEERKQHMGLLPKPKDN